MSENRWSEARKLASLAPDFRNRIDGVLERLRSAGFDPHIEYAWRSQATQDALVAKGVSSRRVSVHTGDGTEGTGRACDIVDTTHRWGVASAGQSEDLAFLFFGALGVVASMEELSWGGRWRRPDWAHLEAKG